MVVSRSSRDLGQNHRREEKLHSAKLRIRARIGLGSTYGATQRGWKRGEKREFITGRGGGGVGGVGRERGLRGAIGLAR